MDEEGDAERAAQWDLAAADAAYKAQVEAALAHQRAVEEEHRLLLEQLEVLSCLSHHTHCLNCMLCLLFAQPLQNNDSLHSALASSLKFVLVKSLLRAMHSHLPINGQALLLLLLIQPQKMKAFVICWTNYCSHEHRMRCLSLVHCAYPKPLTDIKEV